MAGIIIPRVDLIFSEMNEQFYSRYGLRLVSRPKKLEIMQTAFLEQARAVGELLDEKPLTIDEGRAILELPPKPVTSASAPMPVIIDNLPKPIDVSSPKPAQIAEPKPVGLPKPIDATATIKALTDWRRLSLDHLRLKKSAVIGPSSVAIPLVTAQEIVTELGSCRKAADVRTVFESRINVLKRGTNGAQPDATTELKRANDLLERALPFVDVDA